MRTDLKRDVVLCFTPTSLSLCEGDLSDSGPEGCLAGLNGHSFLLVDVIITARADPTKIEARREKK